jgi:signal transduction histidine kinase
LQPVHDDLATVLATLRFRLQPRLADAGVHVDWQVEALPPMPGLTPNVVLQIQRILLEAFTNVMRHARATRLEVGARFLETPTPMFCLVVQDNGIGTQTATGEVRGLGLSNMQARASAIGAALTVSSVASGGTRVELSLPLNPVTSL